MTGSRLARDDDDRLVCVDASGHLWLVLDLVTVFNFVPRGRPPTPQERAEARAPYEAVSSKRDRRERRDDELDERAALEAYRLEQQRQPPDLVNVAA